MEPIIKAVNVNFTYNKDKDNEFQALVNISCKIFPEEYIIIFGPSGCGKSTLLNVMAALELPDSGDIEVMGRDLKKLTKNELAFYHRKNVGMIYQQYNLINSLSVLDNVALPQVFINARKGKRNKWARRLLERFDILKQAKKIPSELSGGQQQRIGIARAIANNPKIVLADEPVGNLDSVSAKNVFNILKELNEKEKKTIILVTHNPECLSYGDRIFYMKDGIITREVVNRDKHKKTEKKFMPKTTTAEINDLMRAYHGLTPEQINILIMPYKAKAFAHHFISSRNMEETKVLEDIIQRRLLGTISQEDFFDTLHSHSGRGGVGFDIRTAEKMLRRVNRIIRTAYYVYQEERKRKDVYGRHLQISDEEKADKVTWYLLKTCYHKYFQNLDEVQIERVKQAIKDRLTASIQKEGFFKALDKPFKEGGAGLNSKTAKAMTEELELILILGYGIVQKTSIAERAETTTTAGLGPSLAKGEESFAPAIQKEEPSAKKEVEDAPSISSPQASSGQAGHAKEMADAETEEIKPEKLELTAAEAARLAQVSGTLEAVGEGEHSGTSAAQTLHQQILEAQKMKEESQEHLDSSEQTMKEIKDINGKNIEDKPDQSAGAEKTEDEETINNQEDKKKDELSQDLAPEGTVPDEKIINEENKKE